MAADSSCTSLSMAGAVLPEVRTSLAGFDLDQCKAMAKVALEAADAEAARLAAAGVAG